VAKFQSTGLVLDHVNGHLNMHLHPTIFSLLVRRAHEWGVRKIRLTADPLWINLRLGAGQWFYRLSHGFIFGLLSSWARPRLRAAGIGHAGAVFGLLQNGRVNERYVKKLIPELRGDSELYSHPCVEDFKHELEALVSPAVATAIKEHQVKLIRYQDL
jgi:chitin disaccharide deacetylase